MVSSCLSSGLGFWAKQSLRHQIDALQIRWPSGLIQRFADLPVNTTLRFTEGQGTWEPVYGEARCVEENSSVA